MQAEHVTDAKTFQAWLDIVLTKGAGRNDAIFVRLAAQTAEPGHLDALNRALQPSETRRLETEQMGEALCRTVQAVWAEMPLGLSYPVALGQAARAMEMPINPVVQMALHAFSANLVSAAIRLNVMGQTDGQKVLDALNPLCLSIAEDTEGATRHDLGTTPLLSDINAMQHETLYSRIFRS